MKRIARAGFNALLRVMGPLLLAMLLVGGGLSWLSAAEGDWAPLVILAVVLLSLLLTLWRSASRPAAQLPLGSWIAYAVTPDGTLHASTAAGTATINPGYVASVAGTPGVWIIRLVLPNVVMVVPRELLPDTDAALLVRHTSRRLIAPPAATQP